MHQSSEPSPGVRARAGRGIRPRHLAAITALAASATLAGGVAGPAIAQAGTKPAPPVATGHTVNVGSLPARAAANRIASYWTRSKMLSARNADKLTIKAGTHLPKAPSSPSGPAHRVAGVKPTQAPAGGIRHVPGLSNLQNAPLAGATGSPWPGNFYLPPATTSGKVFFTTTAGGVDENWVCSGSTVNSNGKNVVFTAGHCVYGSLGGEVPGEGWHSNWVFVPDYSNGYAPYGVWTARQLWTLTNYLNTGGSLADEADDIGAVVVNTNAAGQHIVNVVGGQGIAWNYAPSQAVYDFGYPAAAPFTGNILEYCNGTEFDWSSVVPSTMGLLCNFTGGSSGGPWLAFFNGEFGYVNGVNDFGYSTLPQYIFAGQFKNNAAALYNSVANL
jgi:V8-like Glu-specific endopeptidase